MRTSGDTICPVPRLIHHPGLAGTACPAACRRLAVDTHIPRAFRDTSACGGLVIAFEQITDAANNPYDSRRRFPAYRPDARSGLFPGGHPERRLFFVQETASVRKDVYGSRFYRSSGVGVEPGAALATVGCHSLDKMCHAIHHFRTPFFRTELVVQRPGHQHRPCHRVNHQATAPPFPDIPRPHPGTFWHPPDAALLPFRLRLRFLRLNPAAVMPRQLPLPARQVCC